MSFTAGSTRGFAIRGNHVRGDYPSGVTIEGQAFRSEDNGPVAGSGLQTELVERTPEENANAEPSTKDGIEAVRFGVFAPPGSPLDRQCHDVSGNE